MRRAFLLFIAMLCLWSESFAQTQQAQSDILDILVLKDKIIEVQNQAPLGIKSLYACSKINGFGSYVPLEASKIKNGERLIVYFEPVNYFTKKEGARYTINLVEDMLVLNEKGDILWGREGALKYDYTSNQPMLDLFMTNAIDIKGLPAGKYNLKITLNDKIKNRSVVDILPFEVEVSSSGTVSPSS